MVDSGLGEQEEAAKDIGKERASGWRTQETVIPGSQVKMESPRRWNVSLAKCC